MSNKSAVLAGDRRVLERQGGWVKRNSFLAPPAWRSGAMSHIPEREAGGAVTSLFGNLFVVVGALMADQHGKGDPPSQGIIPSVELA